MNSKQYNSPPSTGDLFLSATDVHVWRVCLDPDSRYVSKLFQTLSMDEMHKADKFHFDKDRNRFVVARGTLRKILGRYLNLTPNRISFSYSRYGKPFLDAGNDSLRFNVSHSRGLALIAVTSGREIGIDIEFIDDDREVLKTAKNIFSPAVLSKLRSIDPELRVGAFFRGWTRTEAFFKAVGTGFSDPGKQLSEPIMPAESYFSAETIRFKEAKNWTLVTLPFDPRYASAVAVEGGIGTIGFHQLCAE
jgi:4'-phosphopantetheinyl transferase